MHIAILSSESPDSACARIRLHDVLKQLRPDVSFTWTGVGKEPLSIGDIEPILKSSDAIVVQRSFPRPNTMDVLQTTLFESGKPVIYETDDLLTELPETNSKFSRYTKYRHLIMNCIANSDAIITSTSALKDRYAFLNQQGYVYRNALDEALWRHPLGQRKAAGVKRKLNVGFCGSSSHSADLECIETALERVYESYGSNVQFSFFGCITERLKRLPGMTYQEGFVSYSNYAELLRTLQFDIGLAPLENSVFNSCKSNIKFLEYAACGIPGVYSDLGPYRDSIAHGRTGLLAENSPDAWFDAIANLIENPALAQEIVEAAHQDMWSRYSLQANANDWLKIVKQIVAAHSNGTTDRPGNRSSLARTMWSQTVDYERQLAEMDAKYKDTKNQLDWLCSRPMIRAMKAAGDLFKIGRPRE